MYNYIVFVMVDLKTIFLCEILVEILLTLALFLYWKTQKTYPGFYEWILALFISSIKVTNELGTNSKSTFKSLANSWAKSLSIPENC